MVAVFGLVVGQGLGGQALDLGGERLGEEGLGLEGGGLQGELDPLQQAAEGLVEGLFGIRLAGEVVGLAFGVGQRAQGAAQLALARLDGGGAGAGGGLGVLALRPGGLALQALLQGDGLAQGAADGVEGLGQLGGLGVVLGRQDAVAEVVGDLQRQLGEAGEQPGVALAHGFAHLGLAHLGLAGVRLVGHEQNENTRSAERQGFSRFSSPPQAEPRAR